METMKSNNTSAAAATAAPANKTCNNSALYAHCNSIEFLAACQSMTPAERAAYINYSITHHDKKLKLAGFDSISTSCICNAGCIARHNCDDSICRSCYAFRQLARYKTLREKLEKNYIFYNSIRLRPEEVPLINSQYFRFEAFGEAASVTCAANYMTIADKNPHCTFTAWTKAPVIYIAAMQERGGKPANLRLLLSVPEVNGDPNKPEIPEGFNGLFVVHDKDHAPVLHTRIKNYTCNGHCADCMLCYNSPFQIVIHEKKK